MTESIDTLNQERAAFLMNLIQLRRTSFQVMLVIVLAAAWVWFSLSVWPQDRRDTPILPQAWPVSALLLVLVAVCYGLIGSHPHSAMIVFVAGLVVDISWALHMISLAELAYFYVLPVIFSSVLLGQGWLILITLAACALMGGIGLTDPDVPLNSLALPALVVTITAVSLSVSTSNLQTALAWSLNGYRHAHKNELLARERKAQLEQALISLDKALAKLQRTNLRLIEVSLQAEEARRLKQQFAQTISHELRTPLNLIVGFTETMIKSPEYYGRPLSGAYLRDLSVVYRNACHLQSLVNDVLDLARLESAYTSLETEELSVKQLVEDAVNTARQLVEGRGLALETDTADDLPPVWGDLVRLKQVLLNLLNNAARFTEKGRVVVSARAADNEVIFSVSDTGIGISAENLTQVFESFRQIDNPLQRRSEGIGLGLAISQQLIHLHGGRIWVESEVGVGSTFFFSLPARRIESLSADLLAAAPALPGDVPQRMLLVVTRSPSSAAFLARNLPDYRALVVTDLAQVHHTARQILPEAVILDTHLPGLEDASPESIAARLNLPELNIITCPLPGEEPLRQRLAADGCLIKPITRESLWDMLRQFSDEKNSLLIVDDDHDFARLISRMLAGARHYQVNFAYTGQEALDMIRHNPPGVLLADMNLPDLNGAQLISAIRADARLSKIRVVVMTAHEEIGSVSVVDGAITLTRQNGLWPNEILQWLRAGLAIGE